MELASPACIDWALVAFFYAALHYVEAYLALRGVHITHHSRRDTVIGGDENLRTIYRQYRELKTFGYAARYETYNLSSHTVQEASEYLDDIKHLIDDLL